MKRLKILFISNLFPTPSEPTRGVFKHQLVRALQGRCDVSVVCPLPWFPRISILRGCKKWYRFAEVPARFEWQGVRVVAPKYYWLPGLNRRYHAYAMFEGIRRVCFGLHRQHEFDLVHSHWIFPDGVAAQCVADKLHIPHVPTGCGCDVNQLDTHSSAGRATLQMLGRAAHVITVSSRMRDRLASLGIAANRVTAVANGVDSARFQPVGMNEARQATGLDAGAKHVLFVGRLGREKGVDVLIRAFAEVNKHVNAHLTVIGEGELRAELESLVQKLDGRDRVSFVGEVPHDSIKQWMSAADCLCLPSLREGCPNVVLEALACGLPVVASDVGAVSDFVDEFSGVLTTPGDAKSLASGIGIALGQTWSRNAISARMRERTWDSAARDYETVFAKAIGETYKSQECLWSQPQTT